jgi:peptide/nickel transport system ATP-binding protein
MSDPRAVPTLEVSGLKRFFDVSPPFLNRVLDGTGRRIVRAVDGVSFRIDKGETFGLVGESGCGKSTIARLVVGLYEPTAGAIKLGGIELSATLDQARRAGKPSPVQMIFQDPYASLNPRWRAGSIIAEPLHFRGRLGTEEIRHRVDELLGQVGLSPRDADKYPHEFSGGQRQRISIARALASEPDFLVCDEPTSALDVSVQAQILNLMKDLQRQFGLTYLFISHNLAVVHHVAAKVGVMYLGRLVERSETASLFRRPLHPYTRMLLDAVPDLSMTGVARTPIRGEVPTALDPPPGCAFHPRCPFANERCQREVPELKGGTMGAVACHAVEEDRLPPWVARTRGAA